MRFLFHLLAFFSVALIVGFGLSYYALEKGGLFGTLRIGPWVAWTEVGSPHPDPYSRAYISRSSALEMARAEGIKFFAEQDSDGQDLRAECSYRIDGSTPQSTFWTLVAAERNGTLISRSGTRSAFHSNRIVRESDGAFALHVGPIPKPGNWLEIDSKGAFTLILTLYDSSIFSKFGSPVEILPSIFIEGC